MISFQITLHILCIQSLGRTTLLRLLLEIKVTNDSSRNHFQNRCTKRRSNKFSSNACHIQTHTIFMKFIDIIISTLQKWCVLSWLLLQWTLWHQIYCAFYGEILFPFGINPPNRRIMKRLYISNCDNGFLQNQLKLSVFLKSSSWAINVWNVRFLTALCLRT